MPVTRGQRNGKNLFALGRGVGDTIEVMKAAGVQHGWSDKRAGGAAGVGTSIISRALGLSVLVLLALRG